MVSARGSAWLVRGRFSCDSLVVVSQGADRARLGFMASELREKAFLLGAYQYLAQHDRMLRDVQILTLALRATLRELGPDAEKRFASNYLAESEKLDADAMQKSLAQLVQQLKGRGDREN